MQRFIVALGLGTFFAIGCGDDTSSSPDAAQQVDAARFDAPAIDAPAIDAPAVDAPAIDAPMLDAQAIDAETPDAGPTLPSGTRLDTGSLALWGVTSDDVALYTDSSLVLYAVPLAGGARQQLTTVGANLLIVVQGKVAFIWKDLASSGTPVSALGIYTSATGYHDAVTTQASIYAAAAASPDGSRVMFTGNYSATNSTYDLIAANTDLTGATTLITGADYSVCQPTPGFAGAGASAIALAGYCPAGQTSATLSKWTGASWTKTDLSLLAQPLWSADAAGTRIFANSTAGDGIVLPIAGGAATTIDNTVSHGFITANGQNVVYLQSQRLKRSAVVNPAPFSLGPSNILDTLGNPSPDQSKWMYFTAQSGTTFLTDVNLTSTVTQGAGVTLESSTASGLFGDSWTADSSKPLFYTNIDTTNYIGTLKTCNAGCTAATTLTTNAYIDYALSGTQIVVNDNFAPGGLFGRADIEKVDAAATPPLLTRLVSQADAFFFVSASRNRIIYTYAGPTSLTGLWVQAIP
jgi:hypothetical protein